MSHFKSDLRAALLAAGIFAVSPALYAQAEEQVPAAQDETTVPEEATAPEPATTDPSTTAASTPVSEAKIDQFATAYVAVQHIQAKTSEKLSTTTDVAKANEVKAAAETDMIKAVEQSGLQVDEFNQIAQLMASDPALRTKVIEKVQEKS
jgi:hypothetical protein